MKRTRAQQPKVQEPQDPAAANANPKPQRRAKQPRQPKGAAKKPTAAACSEAIAVAVAAAAVAANAAASPGSEMAPTGPNVCSAREGEADAQTVEWDLDSGISNGSWWTWGVEEEKLLGWFPFVEEDFRCLGGRGGDAEMATFDDDIWRIHQIYEIPNYAAK
ncbi:uncharacterized protein LOC133895811 [Phragmites australis]|uniref:uncharacterized protein LOC133895811 n=1 Tax=Phragmites australis TaxID=29695 RepID=UPI002D76DA0D|nr:uncharacterized protein LOC133895811 [Phragmites australis]